jgi:phosphate transport system substrate-binding protein
MSYSTYAANKEKLKALKINAGKGPVMPSVETVKSGEYQALSSPMYLYASEASLQKPAIKAFIKYYLENASKLVMKSGYIPLPDSEYHEQAKTCQ